MLGKGVRGGDVERRVSSVTLSALSALGCHKAGSQKKTTGKAEAHFVEKPKGRTVVDPERVKRNGEKEDVSLLKKTSE